jgi:glycosyltransferase involved in cell wall biosynthesis
LSNKVYIVTYYWPPAGGPGVQRWLKFAKYLPEFGHDVNVVIPENPDYPVIDATLLDQIPKGVNVIKVPIAEPSRWIGKLSRKRTKDLQRGIIEKSNPSWLQNVLLWIRGNYFIPDARVGWKKNLLEALSATVENDDETTVITTGPPHSVHLTGLELKNKLSKIQWIADFRDPWTTIGYHKELKLGARAAKKHIQLESEILQKANKIIVTSQPTKTEFVAKTTRPIHVITNGFDVKVNDRQAQPDGKFSLNHVGTLLSERNPEVLWQVLSELFSSDNLFAEDLKIGLAGNVSESVLQSIHDFGLSNNLNQYGYLSHSESFELMKNSQCLLLIEINSRDTAAIIPGKLFEYLASKRPIIALGPEGSDVEQIIEETQAGSYFLYEQKELLKKHILQKYQVYKEGKNSANAASINQYHRKQLTSKLSEMIIS